MARKSKTTVHPPEDREQLISQVRLALKELDKLLAKFGSEPGPAGLKPRRGGSKRSA